MSGILAGTPDFTPGEAAELWADAYGDVIQVDRLPSERDQNFRVSTAKGTRLLKIFNAREDPAFVGVQHQVWDRLGDHVDYCPRLIKTRSGSPTRTVASPRLGTEHMARATTWLDGTPLSEVGYRSASLLRDLGAKLGALDDALAGFDHPAAHRAFRWDLRRAPAVLAQHRDHLDGAGGKWADRVDELYAGRVVPRLERLRTSVIHNDANDHNILCGGGRDPWTRHQTVTGIVDWGDMVHSYTVGNVAVALAYVALDHDDPLGAASAVIHGYQPVYPLTEDELDVLWGMTLMRLAVSMVLAAVQQRERPDDAYLTVSQDSVQVVLPALLELPYGYATAVLRHAAEVEPVRGASAVADHLTSIAGTTQPVLGVPFTQDNTIKLDLGVDSLVSTGDPTVFDASEVGIPSAERKMAAAGASFAVGAFGEARLIYTHPVFATGPSPLSERRTIHLGVDLFAAVGSPVHAPLAGLVRAVGPAPEPQGYGHAITLRHETPGGVPFWTLYGHLSADSLATVAPGDRIEAGHPIGSIGPPEENGGWSPHLHFMVITDMLDHAHDFPGVGLASHLEVWTSLAIDPSPLLGIPASLAPQEPSAAETASRRARYLAPSLRLSYQEPVRLARGWMQWLWDDAGRRYLDAYNNVPHIGHAHPAVVAAAARQMAVLNTNTRYLHESIIRYAERLGATLPPPLDVCVFTNSASEANEVAVRMARAATGRRGMVVLEDAYHGHTTSLIDLSPYKHSGPGGEGPPDWVAVAAVPDTYRGPYHADDPAAAARYAADVKRACADLASDWGVAGFLAETFPSVAGQIVPPAGYLAAAYEHVRAAGGLVIADEVQTGYGRTGTLYAFEQQGVVPDIVVLGKPIGNGHPIGAVVTTREIADSFDTGMEFFSTFGGNTVSAAVGLAVLDVLERDGLVAHSQEVGGDLLQALGELPSRHPIVGDVRGRGLYLGVELVLDAGTLDPATDEASFVVNQLRQRGILIGTEGPFGNVLKIRPPLPFDHRNVALLVEHLDVVLGWLH